MCIHMERIFLRKELRNENGGSVYILIQTTWDRKEKMQNKTSVAFFNKGKKKRAHNVFLP